MLSQIGVVAGAAKRGLWLCGLGVLAGCVGSTAPRAGCRLAVVARYALQPFAGGKPVIALPINGRVLLMAVDSGAESSVLTAAGAAALGVGPGPVARREVIGVDGGRRSYGVVRVAEIGFGGQTVRDLALPVIPLARSGGLGGLVGEDLLGAYGVDFDFSGRRMTLTRGHGCAAARERGMPFVGDGVLPVVAVTLDGRVLRALIDTGAATSMVDEGRAELDEAALAGDRTSLGYGADGVALVGRLHRFGALGIGGVEMNDVGVRVGRLAASLGIDMVIGMDVLGRQGLLIDPGARVVVIGVDQAGR